MSASPRTGNTCAPLRLPTPDASENIHLQPYEDEADFYKRIYPLYLALLDKARVFMRETQADPAKTVLFIS